MAYKPWPIKQVAVKVLLDPALVPMHEAEIRRLLVRHEVEAADLPTKIRVMVSPDRDAAIPHVVRLHTGLAKVAWDLDQQANFYYALLESGVSTDEIRTRYPNTVPRFIRMGAVRRFLNGVRISDTELRDFVDTKLPMSALEYAYRRTEIGDAVGITFDTDGRLLPTTKSPQKIGESLSVERRKGLIYLLEGFRGRDGEVKYSSRSPEFRKDHPKQQALLDTLAELATGKAIAHSPVQPASFPVDGSTTAGSVTEGSAEAERISTAAPDAYVVVPPVPLKPRGPNHPDTKDRLQMGGIDYHDHVSVNLERRYVELRSINLSTHPLAAAILMRSVLETTIKQHFESTSRPSGELKNVFKAVQTTYGSERSLKRAIGIVDSGAITVPGSILWFNFIAHDSDASATPEDVRQAWNLINPVIRRLLLPA